MAKVNEPDPSNRLLPRGDGGRADDKDEEQDPSLPAGYTINEAFRRDYFRESLARLNYAFLASESRVCRKQQQQQEQFSAKKEGLFHCLLQQRTSENQA